MIVCIEHTIGVRYRRSRTVAVNTGECRDDVVGGMRDQRREMLTADGAIVEHEIEQIRHQLKIGGNIWIISAQVNVVEREMNHVRDVVTKIATRCLCVFGSVGQQYPVSSKGAAARARMRGVMSYLMVEMSKDCRRA
jgi:hypothetical protein